MLDSAVRQDFFSRSDVAHHPVDVHIGKRIRLRRTMLGLSQENVADAVGVAFQQIQKYEAAVNRISVPRLWALGQALQCDVAYFYEGLDHSESNAPVANAASELPLDNDALRFIRAYSTIKQSETRQRILSLAMTLAGHRKDAAETDVVGELR